MHLDTVQWVTISIVALLSLVGVGLFVRAVLGIYRVITLGRPDESRSGQVGARVFSLFAETLGHARLGRWPLIGALHWFVFIGFGVLFFTLVTAYGQLFAPEFALPIVGHWAPYEWLSELTAWLTLVAIGALIVIRQKNHPRRFRSSGGRASRFFGSSFWQAYYVEATIAVVAVCVIALRALEFALATARHEADPSGAPAPGVLHYPSSAWLGDLFAGASPGALEHAVVLVATLKIVVSMAWFITIALQPTMGVAWHRFLAFFNVWFKRHPGRAPERGLMTSLGALQPIVIDGAPLDFEKIEDLDEDAALGVGVVEQFTWKGLLDFSTCTECGRCQSQCPAWNTDKPLSPKLTILALRDHAHAKAPWLLATQAAGSSGQKKSLKNEPSDVAGALGRAHGEAQRPLVGAPDPIDVLAGGVIDPEALWACTTCGACVEQCPVDIEHVDHIVDLRRYQVLIESAFPSELGGMFKNLEKNANPWGVSPRQRLDWAKNLPFEVKQVGVDVEDLSEVEYLFWVGCAGAFEDRQKKTTRAIAELLDTAGVSFAVLGDGESCTGDPARRAGNEFLFAMLAQANVETLNEARATKIVVSCAHCFNTLKNEYPQLGGTYEVVHHTQLLNRLVREKRLSPIAPVEGVRSVTYHDPCYLGRHNGVYSPPRELIEALPGVELVEMDRNSATSFCCGAGGARMWMEETIGTRINSVRTAEAVSTGASQIAVACPFCRVMLGDGLTAAQSAGTAGAEIEVVDVAQMLLAAVQRGAGPGSVPVGAPA